MAKATLPNPGRTGNRLLDGLAPEDFKPLAKALEPAQLSAQQLIFRAGEPVEHLYFPTTAVLTLTVGDTFQNGRSIEFASVGNEGMAGFTALLGVPTSLHQVVCQTAGDCLRLPTAILLKAMARRQSISIRLKRYIAVAYRTAVQAVVCNALHSVEQRVCRWLLATHDKAGGVVPATQDVLADILGVKRPTISIVANSLQQAGLISYHRGTVRILNREGLEQATCACYHVTKAVYKHIIEPEP